MEQNSLTEIAGYTSALIVGSLPMIIGYLLMVVFVIAIAWPLYRMWRRN